MRELDESKLCGRIRALPLVNVAAFRARTPFVSPADGKNLNRCFPGDPAGTFSDHLAHEVHSRFIAGSDAVVDLHAGDMVEALAPFTLYDESKVADGASQLAEAYGLPCSIRQPAAERVVNGSTSSAAADLGIPAIIAEAGGCGLVEAEPVAVHLAGLRRLVTDLGMLPPVRPAERRPVVRRFNRLLWVRAGVEGWWDASVGVGQDVAEGQRLGRVLDLFGDELESVFSPETGCAVFLTTSPAVAPDGLLVCLAVGEQR